MARVRAVIFDWGGTLTPWHDVDVRAIWRAYVDAYAAGATGAGAGAAGDPPDALLDALIEADSAGWRSAREHDTSPTVDAIVTAAGADPARPSHPAALAAYHDAWVPHTITDPEVPALFGGLRSDGIAVGILSNTIWPRAVHEDIFRRDGVLDLIDGAVYTSEIPVIKPHPDAFAAALAAVGDPGPAAAVYVGDRLFDDIYGAQQVGMRAILVPHSAIPSDQLGPTEGRPDAVVDTIGEVLAVIRRWNAAGAGELSAGGVTQL